jgi:hypothetical protein
MQNEKIKVGAVLVAIDRCKLDHENEYALIVGKEYKIQTVDSDKKEFTITSESFNVHEFDFSDIPTFFKFKEEPTEDEIKEGDEYVGNHTHKKYTVVGIVKGTFNLEREDGIVRNWTKDDIKNGLYKKPKPSETDPSDAMFTNRIKAKLEPIEEVEGFYMVVVSGSIYPPTEQHKDFDYALGEATRLSKKENKTAYVLKAVAQVEQVSKITNFKK